MTRLRVLWARVLGLLGLRWRDDDLRDEIDAHIDLLAAGHRQRGLSEYAARLAAKRDFGGVDQTTERYRDRRGFPFVDTVRRDVVYAFRQMRCHPLFAATTVLTLALAIAANSVVFAALNATLRQLPFRDADRIVVIHAVPQNGASVPLLSVPEYLTLRDRSRAFDHVGAMVDWPYNLGAAQNGTPAERLYGWRYTDTLFEVLSVRPQIGRPFTPEENGLNAPPGSALISHRLWLTRFGGDPNIVGATVRLDDVATTIVGVMPPAFSLLDNDPASDIWTPLPFLSTQLVPSQRPAVRFVTVLAHLKPGVSLEAAQGDLDSLSDQLAGQYPVSNKGWTFRPQRLADVYFGSVRPLIVILQAAAVLLLLIACSNIAGLLLIRATGRQHEVATRCALGASARHVISQFLTESTVLAVAGGALGVAATIPAVRLLSGVKLQWLSRVPPLAVDARVLIFTAAISMLTAVVFGLVPAVQLLRTDLFTRMRQSGRGLGAASSQRMRTLLVTSQVAMTLVLLIAGGLLGQNFLRLQRANLGADTSQVLSFDTRLPQAPYQKPAGTYRGLRMLESSPVPARIFTNILEGLQGIPGVGAAGGTTWPPFGTETREVSFSIEGQPQSDARPGDEGALPKALYYQVTPGFFGTMRIPIRVGRDFASYDTVTTPWVAVVNEAMASRYWSNHSPIGQRVTARLTADEQPREIVGIVGNVALSPRERTATPMVYVMRAQQPSHFLAVYGQRTQMTYVVRLREPIASVLPSIRRAVAAVEPTLPLVNVQLLDDALARQIEMPRFYMVVFAGFGMVATVLAGLGLYGVMAYAVTQRSREIAVRVALGATPRRILALMLRQGALTMTVGIAIGVVAAAALTRFLQAVLWEVAARDARTFVGAATALGAIGFFATLMPTVRALRINPRAALSDE